MIRPRWQGLKPQQNAGAWRRWDRMVAIIATLNLAWVLVDLSYIPLRNFWLQRNLYPVASLPLVVPLPWLPDITPVLDPLKGIEPLRETQAYLDGFKRLDQALQTDSSLSSATISLLKQQQTLTQELISSQRFLSSSNVGALDQLKNRQSNSTFS